MRIEEQMAGQVRYSGSNYTQIIRKARALSWGAVLHTVRGGGLTHRSAIRSLDCDTKSRSDLLRLIAIRL